MEGAGATLPPGEAQILTLLELHGSLAADQIAAHLHEQPDAVQNALRGLHEHGLIDVLLAVSFTA